MAAWISLIATALGALIAFSGNTLSEGMKSRREQSRSQLETQRQVTVEFILAADNVHGLLRQVGMQSLEALELRRAAREAVGNSGIYGTREKLLISAPPEVAVAAEAEFHALIGIRDAIEHGAKPGSPPYDEAYNAWAETVWTVRQVAREAFGVSRLNLNKINKIEADRLEKRSSKSDSS
jgi:hypothetical protein